MAENMRDGKFAHNTTAPPQEHRVLPLFSLTGRTAIVTGAGAGIGLAVAQALAEAGANVAIWYNSNAQAVTRAAEISATYGVQCRAYQVNVTSPEAVEAAVDAAVADLGGRLDVFVANSGVAWEQGPMLDGGLDHYRKVTGTNVDGTFYSARAAGRHFRRQKREGTTVDGRKLEGFNLGSFIATASMSGHIANVPQLQAAYNASKAAVIHLCKSLGVEWAGFARANSVSPGYIQTEISQFCSPEIRSVWADKIPMGREGQPAELKGVYLYLASDASSYTTGTDIIVDGGYCAP
ncbi:sorbitol utilization protein SOU2 [Coniochaeta ligniaria NRRL 30616]|uniref:Sorbitol utilization protein SOU2 n=1 Tax=Coniochaeta ligniaria NRRL 30616 TaxID=1408157 RepID=A0A1J7IRJ5_9PEZI|nr:sorbitol utilization protein SOU2 [Coniochaeta ligniaria NRRL 30616]